MARVIRFTELGAHASGVRRGGSAPGDDDLRDAVDLVLELDDGSRTVLGLRTRDYQGRLRDLETWVPDYRPIPITLKLSDVKYFDFDELLWLGTAEHPCLLWSNAQGFTLKGIRTWLGDFADRSLRGKDQRGLPSPEALQVVVPDGAVWHTVRRSDALPIT